MDRHTWMDAGRIDPRGCGEAMQGTSNRKVRDPNADARLARYRDELVEHLPYDYIYACILDDVTGAGAEGDRWITVNKIPLSIALQRMRKGRASKDGINLAKVYGVRQYDRLRRARTMRELCTEREMRTIAARAPQRCTNDGERVEWALARILHERFDHTSDGSEAPEFRDGEVKYWGGIVDSCDANFWGCAKIESMIDKWHNPDKK